MSLNHDPLRTQPLPRLTHVLARTVPLPLGAILALALLAILLTGLTVGMLRRPALPPAIIRTATPTLGVPGMPPPGPGLPRAVIAYDAPDGRVLGALEPGRAYTVVARSGLSWAQLNVAGLLAPPNLVWVRAEEVPELRVAAAVADLATPLPTITPQVILVAAPAAPASAPAMRAVAPAGAAPLLDTAVPLPSPAPVYLIPPATPVLRPIVMRPIPTAPPCRLHELGSVLRICNGVTP